MAQKNVKKDKSLKNAAEKALEVIRQELRQDGGDIALLGVNEKEGVIRVKFKGACAHCPMARLTFTQVVEKILKEKVKRIKKVIAV